MRVFGMAWSTTKSPAHRMPGVGGAMIPTYSRPQTRSWTVGCVHPTSQCTHNKHDLQNAQCLHCG